MGMKKTQNPSRVPARDPGVIIQELRLSLQGKVDDDAEREKQLDKLEVKSDKQEKKLDQLEVKGDKLEEKGDKLETKLEKLEKKYDQLEAKLDKIEKKADRRRQASFGTSEVKLQKIRWPLQATSLLQSKKLTLEMSRSAQDLRADRLFTAFRRTVRLAENLDQLETELDKRETDSDTREKRWDIVEQLLDGLEKQADADEAAKDQLEEKLDALEASLDAEEYRRRETSGRASKRPGRKPGVTQTSPGVAQDPVRIGALIGELRHAGRRSRAASNALQSIGRTATPMLMEAYGDAEEHARWEIVNALGYIRDDRAIPFLVRYGTQDPEIHPRWRSIWALTSVDDGSARGALLKVLRISSGTRKRNAAVALSIFGDHSAVPVLRSGLKSSVPWERWESASCLAGLVDQRTALEIIRVYSTEKDEGVRKEFVRALSGVCKPYVVRFLKRRMSEPDPVLRIVAVSSLAESLNGNAQRVLSRLLTKERHPAVRAQILTAMRASA
jgi:HEAT repeat protein